MIILLIYKKYRLLLLKR